MCWEDVPLFLGQFFGLLYFCVGFFFQFADAFFGSILPIFAYFFAVYYVYFYQNVKQCFGHKIFVMYN